MSLFGLPHNTVVVALAVAAVGFAAGVVGCFGVLRRRALAGDAAAHATLAGVVVAFLATGRRDLPTLLGGAFVAAVAALGVLVLIRRLTRTRDDAATALVLGVAFGVGIALLSGLSARGIPGAGGLEQFLMGHTAALTVDDAKSLAVASLAAVLCAGLAVKEATLVAFDPAFAAASGWPVTLIDYCLVGLVALMVVVGLPAAGAVLVTALVVIPPVTARQWTDRVPMMLVLAGCIGLAAAIGGVALSAAVPKLPTGPTIVLVAASLFAVSFLAAPGRGWLARRREVRDTERTWVEGRLLCAALEATDAHPGASFGRPEVEARAGSQRGKAAAWDALVRRGAFVPLRDAGNHWRLSPAGRAAATERAQRIAAWGRVLAERPADARGLLTIDLPAPEAVLGAERAVGRAEN